MRARLWVAVSLMTLATACGFSNPTGPLDPYETIVQMEPPPSEYYVYWLYLLDQVKVPQYRAYFYEIKFYRVGNDKTFACRELERGCYGCFSNQDNEIYIAGAWIDNGDVFVPMHEMLHAIIGDHDHSDPIWKRLGLYSKSDDDLFYGRGFEGLPLLIKQK